MTVRAPYVEWSTGPLVLGPPKSKAGRRVVGIPQAIIPVLREHMATFVKAEPDALAFSGIKGGPLRRSGFNRLASWWEAVRVVGAECLHVHDLRHTGNMIAAESGAGLKDLMARMGHDNVRAATIYQHVVRGPTKRSQMLSTSTSAVRMTRVRTGRPGARARGLIAR
ncbi:tyrosine-type recombinase/integrase [Sphaerisporangium sp. NPDC005288]|uniref:tyrosine-type recombinase/integrase n=1 Tax=Sphaerisporangium sp. NPDC005288 TaxID=3155114 RepID=UPI0033BF0B68